MNYEKLKIKFADINTSNSPNIKQLPPVLKNIVDNAGKPSYGRRWIDASKIFFMTLLFTSFSALLVVYN